MADQRPKKQLRRAYQPNFLNNTNLTSLKRDLDREFIAIANAMVIFNQWFGEVEKYQLNKNTVSVNSRLEALEKKAGIVVPVDK